MRRIRHIGIFMVNMVQSPSRLAAWLRLAGDSARADKKHTFSKAQKLSKIILSGYLRV